MAKKEQIKKGKIIIYKAPKGQASVEVRLEKETVWLSLDQIAGLFNTDKSGISRHIKNIYNSGELSEYSTVAKIATVQKEGNRQIERKIEYYNLDVILSIGYRVNSGRATQFRIWATKTLKDHLVQGYTINRKRLMQAQEKFDQLQKAVAFLQTKSKHKLLGDQSQEILDLLSSYSKSLSILEQYDTGRLKIIKANRPQFILKTEDCRKIIEKVKRELAAKKEASEFFGQEPAEKLEGIIKGLYQTFDGKELYGSLEEKAAHLLYFTVKDHPFIDGNKRISSFLFIYFLDKNKYLEKISGEKKINDNALIALTLLVAVSNPKDKEIMIKIITNLIK